MSRTRATRRDAHDYNRGDRKDRMRRRWQRRTGTGNLYCATCDTEYPPFGHCACDQPGRSMTP